MRCLPDPAWEVREGFLEEVIFTSGCKGLARRRGVVGKRILGRGKDQPKLGDDRAMARAEGRRAASGGETGLWGSGIRLWVSF